MAGKTGSGTEAATCGRLVQGWEFRGDPEIERDVRDVRELDDGEVIERLCNIAVYAAESGSYYNAEVVLEAARRWSALAAIRAKEGATK